MPAPRFALPVLLLVVLVTACAGAPAAPDAERHARAAEGCVRALERNGGRDVVVDSTQGIGGFEVQVILRQAGGFKTVCRYDSLQRHCRRSRRHEHLRCGGGGRCGRADRYAGAAQLAAQSRAPRHRQHAAARRRRAGSAGAAPVLQAPARRPARTGDALDAATAALWQQFALNQRAYNRFCEQALGKPLPPRAAEALGADAERNDALRRTWYRCCREEGIDPRQPQRLPLLFALDAAIGFPGGLHYRTFEGPRRRSDDGDGLYFGAAFGDADAACGDAAGFGGECGSGGGDSADGGDGGGDGGGGGD